VRLNSALQSTQLSYSLQRYINFLHKVVSNRNLWAT